jgi:hypothetical protein
MSNKNYSLICMSFDGDYVVEKTGFKSIEDAWKHSEDMGSRWYFYPFHFVVTTKGQIVKDCPEILNELFINKRLKTVEISFLKFYKETLEVNSSLDSEEYCYELWFKNKKEN